MVILNAPSPTTTSRKEACIHDLIAARAKKTPDDVAIVAPDRRSMTYGSLMDHIDSGVRGSTVWGSVEATEWRWCFPTALKWL